MTLYNYYISGEDSKVTPQNEIWNDYIPVTRDNSKSISLTYGTFFRSCEKFIKDNLNEFPVPKDEDISRVDIFLEKHGKFYHPFRIVLSIGDNDYTFVLNTAVDDTGIMCMDFEVKSLKELNKINSDNIPVLYFNDKFSFEDIDFSMFAGNWFESFCEFHVSKCDDLNRIIVWDPDGNYYLTENEEKAVYKACSRILTDYYDEFSFSQISPWHHAAGDFILKKVNENIEVKLITVRQYSPFAEVDNPSDIDVLQGLLYFFINQSIRMRLDRFDGIYDLVWAGDHCLEGFYDGFMESVGNKKAFLFENKTLKESFNSFLSGISFEELYEMAEDITNSYNKKSPEIPLIKTNLKNHIKKICTFFV